jgi:hypothetical protein
MATGFEAPGKVAVEGGTGPGTLFEFFGDKQETVDVGGGELGPIILSWVGLPKEQLKSRVDALIASLVKMTGDDLAAAGVPAEQLFSAILLLRTRAELSPSLAETMSVELDYLKEILPVMRRQIEADTHVEEDVTQGEEDAEQDALIDGASEGRQGGAKGEQGTKEATTVDEASKEMMQAIVKLFKGKPAAQLKQDIVDEVLAVQRSTAMTYVKCDDWKALASDEADAAKVHLGFVTVRMLVLDRKRMAKGRTDLGEEAAAKLKTRLNADIQALLAFAKEVEEAQMKREIAALEKTQGELEATSRSELDRRFEEEERHARQSLDALRKARDEARAAERRGKSPETHAGSGAGAGEGDRPRVQVSDSYLTPSASDGGEGTVPGRSSEGAMRTRSAREYDGLIAAQEEYIKTFPERRREREAQLDTELGEARARMAQERQEREERFKAFADVRMEADVYLRDMGVNSYVIRLGGIAKQLEKSGADFPYGVLNASLRNGNYVTHIILGGNFSEQQLRDELDRFMGLMHAKTERFQE